MKNEKTQEQNNKKRRFIIKNKKDWFIYVVVIAIIVGFAGIYCWIFEITPTSYILFGVCGGGLLLDAIAYILYLKYSTEEKRKKKEAEDAKKIEEEREEWKRTHIKKAVIVATRVAKDSDSAIMRGVVGVALIGTSGAVIGTSTAKQKQFTTFLLVYEDDTRETKEVENESPLYQEYINYIEV